MKKPKFIQGQDSALSKEDSRLIEAMLNTTFYQDLLQEFYGDRKSSVNMTESNTRMFVFGMSVKDKERGVEGRRRFTYVGNQVVLISCFSSILWTS